MQESYFEIPYLSLKKDFIDMYSDELTENLFLHLLAYIAARPQELNLGDYIVFYTNFYKKQAKR